MIGTHDPSEWRVRPHWLASRID